MTLKNVFKGRPSDSVAVKQGREVSEWEGRSLRPVYRVRESAEGYRASIDLPGVARSGVELSVADGVLTVVGKREGPQGSGWSSAAGSVEQGVVYRLRLALSEAVDAAAISARCEQGLLSVELPKAQSRLRRSIEVS